MGSTATSAAHVETTKSHIVLAITFWFVLAVSAIRPFDYFTWFLEVVPALIAFGVLAVTDRKFQFTTLVYFMICLHAAVLCVGGHWTYARVPLGEWMKPLLHTTRNDYDRIGHFLQGFVPALVGREVILRLGVLRRRKWLFFLVTSICLAISAAYELFEYGVAVSTGSKADDFLGSQGDPWDTQNDMLTALIGAVLAQVLLGRWHDREISRLAGTSVADVA